VPEEIAIEFALIKASRNPSTVDTSGRGNPERTTTPIPDFAKSAREPSISLPSAAPRSMFCGMEHHVENLALSRPLADGLRPCPGEHDAMPGLALEALCDFGHWLLHRVGRNHFSSAAKA
jgi:hypothetical protein